MYPLSFLFFIIMNTSPSPISGKVISGNCISVLKNAPNECIDLVVTDPPYICGYKDRDGRTVHNDTTTDWVQPAFSEIYRVLKNNHFCISFYGWNHIDTFMNAWKSVGFRPVGHLVFQKQYASKVGFLGSRHECAYLLAKGHPEKPKRALKDVIPWKYTGNKLHPTQKPIEVIRPLITAFSKPGDIVLDPFAGSGTTGVAAEQIGRKYILIEQDMEYCHTAEKRLNTSRVQKA